MIKISSLELSIEFLDSDLDYSSSNGFPVVTTNLEVPSAFEGYIMIDGIETKYYKAWNALRNSKRNWDIFLLIPQEKVDELNLLVKEQASKMELFRKTAKIEYMQGFTFSSKNSFCNVETRVWLNSISFSAGLLIKERGVLTKKTRAKISLVEAE